MEYKSWRFLGAIFMSIFTLFTSGLIVVMTIDQGMNVKHIGKSRYLLQVNLNH